MKDAILTVRLPKATRRRIEALARKEGRSISQQAEQLILRGMEQSPLPVRGRSFGPRSLAGVLEGTVVADFDDFRVVRQELSSSLDSRSRRGANRRR